MKCQSLLWVMGHHAPQVIPGGFSEESYNYVIWSMDQVSLEQKYCISRHPKLLSI